MDNLHTIAERVKYLREQTDFVTAIFDGLVGYAIVAADFDGNIIAYNEGAHRLYGYTPEEAIGQRSFNTLYPREFIEAGGLERIISELLVAGSCTFVGEKFARGGGKFPAKIHLSLTRDTNAQAIGFIEFVEDLTLHKEAEQQLIASNKRLETIINLSVGGILVLDTEGGIIRFVNPAAEAILGRKRDELIGSHFGFPVETEAAMEIEIVRQDSKRITAEIQGKEADWNGKKSIILTLRDITEKKLLEEHLQESQKMEAVGTLAGGIAHDFNNILNIIMGYSSMALNSLEAGTPARGQIQEILHAADRAAALTKRLLTFSRKNYVDVKPVNLNDLVLNLQNMLSRIIRENIHFQIKLSDFPLIVRADAGQIEQVLINMCGNAVDAMPEGGRLTLSTTVKDLDPEMLIAHNDLRPGSYALVTIADSGSGMDTVTRGRIFEPFFTTKGIGEGTGLGLAISYRIIQQHCGHIKVQSELGHGTAFQIFLPLSKQTEPLATHTPSDSLSSTEGNETILVVEDEEFLRDLAGLVLESSGYTVILAEDGEDAIHKFMAASDRIDLALIDMIMPKKSGKDVADAIRSLSPDTKILFQSGYTHDMINHGDLVKANEAFIGKPFKPEDLLRKIREVLDQRSISPPVPQ